VVQDAIHRLAAVPACGHPAAEGPPKIVRPDCWSIKPLADHTHGGVEVVYRIAARTDEDEAGGTIGVADQFHDPGDEEHTMRLSILCSGPPQVLIPRARQLPPLTPDVLASHVRDLAGTLTGEQQHPQRSRPDRIDLVAGFPEDRQLGVRQDARARSEDQRPGSFKKGHKKLGGRQRGTPNIFSAASNKDVLEAAYRVGEDANGKLGLVGYLQWVGRHYPKIFAGLLGSVMELQELEIGFPEEPLPTVEVFEEQVRTYIGLGSNDRMRPEPAAPDRHKSQAHGQSPDPDSPGAWTGRNDSVGILMHMAIVAPKEFCGLLQAALPRPTALQRGLAARRAWEERWRAEERRRTEQEPGVAS
jgi:hypothetical protein